MANQQSKELLAFNFASTTFAYRRLAQGISRSPSAFSSFIVEYLDPVIKAVQCAQNLGDIGIAANTPQHLIKNLRAIFQCIRKAGFKLSRAKFHFWGTRSRFPWTYNNNQGNSPTKTKGRQIPWKRQISTIQEGTAKMHSIFDLLSKLYTWF